jgi:hypothetical protein
MKESSVWTLLSPLFKYFETGNLCSHEEGGRADLAVEIQHRRDAYSSLVGHLDTILEPGHPNRVIKVDNTCTNHHPATQDGVSPVERYERLAETNALHSRCYEISRSPASISFLVEWCRRHRPEKLFYELTDAELMTYEIPKIGEPLLKIIIAIL